MPLIAANPRNWWFRKSVGGHPNEFFTHLQNKENQEEDIVYPFLFDLHRSTILLILFTVSP